jgi:hypothetical protein
VHKQINNIFLAHLRLLFASCSLHQNSKKIKTWHYPPAEVSLPGQPTQAKTRIDYQSTDTPLEQDQSDPHDNSDIPMEIDNTDLPGAIDDQHQPDTSSLPGKDTSAGGVGCWQSSSNLIG